MKFEELVRKLERMMEEPLPGREGQVMMAPQGRMNEGAYKASIRSDHRKGAVLMLFYPHPDGTFVPFIKRPAYEGVHSGQIAFPGGKYEESDGGLDRTALRETEEEIGVDASQVRILGKLTEVYIPPSNFMVHPYIGFIDRLPEFNPDPLEVERVIECSFPHLLDKKIRKIGPVQSSSGVILKAPYFAIEKEIVWGATAMMLGEFTYLWEKVERKGI
ncbi:NUDIX hydrolase [Mongoliitalea daihaiensis]|uniref:NUDIX hydrolase n=1 Tax=Mongoliitalea daihaiensis TaxID=2782006 RepID=UPI001F336682|nr:CoA pyrophosphatase [Mongoliitalea daihaiensis]UJP63943.1 CoA pyrophosphatase [Mongoliitalea daihaiensis]